MSRLVVRECVSVWVVTLGSAVGTPASTKSYGISFMLATTPPTYLHTCAPRAFALHNVTAGHVTYGICKLEMWLSCNVLQMMEGKDVVICLKKKSFWKITKPRIIHRVDTEDKESARHDNVTRM